MTDDLDLEPVEPPEDEDVGEPVPDEPVEGDN